MRNCTHPLAATAACRESRTTARQRVKRDLADRFGDDREAYTDGKAAFVDSVLEMAQAAAG